jgi:hypothetical protein
MRSLARGGKLREKLDPKVGAASAGEKNQRGELRPNLDRLTVGVDLGDQWSHYCILGLEGETHAEGQLRTTQQDVADFFRALNAARVAMEVGTHSAWVRGSTFSLENNCGKRWVKQLPSALELPCAKLLEPLHQIPLETVGVDAIEVVSAETLVVALILLQVVANDDEGMRHRDDGSLLAAPCR